MNDSSESPIPIGREPSKETKFFLAWGRESLKANLTLANDALKQLVTLSATLLGGSVVFLDASLMGVSFRALAIAGFFCSLIFSFFGMMPCEEAVLLQAPGDIKEHKKRALSKKRLWLWLSGGSMAAAFGITITGLFMSHFGALR